MQSIFIAQRNFFDIFQVAADLKTVNPVDFELVGKLILAGSSWHEMYLSVGKLDGDVDFLNYNRNVIIVLTIKWLRKLTTFNIKLSMEVKFAGWKWTEKK